MEIIKLETTGTKPINYPLVDYSFLDRKEIEFDRFIIECSRAHKMFNEKWNLRFLHLAHTISLWSKDPSTKVGAVIVRPDKTIASIGFNGFPRGMDDEASLYLDRKEKYDRIIHGEINAILNAKEPLKGYCLYTVPLAPCSRCAVQIIQSGIATVVFPKLGEDLKERWGESVAKTKEYFNESGVEWIEI